MDQGQRGQLSDIFSEAHQLLSAAYSSVIPKIIIVITVLSGFPILWSFMELFKVGRIYRLLFSIIGYAFIILAIFLFTTMRAYRLLAEKYSEVKDTSKYETHHYLAELDAKHFGLQRKVYTISSHLENDGSFLSKHSTKLLAYGDRIDKIEHHQAAYSMPPSEGVITIDAEEKYSDEIKIIPNMKRQTYNKCYWELSFIPALQQGKELKYSYEVKLLPGSFAMDHKTMIQRNLNFEYAATTISYPTEAFQRKVIFPKNFIPTNLGYDVWLGDAQVRHTKEYIRIEQEHFFRKGVDEDECLYIELHIHHPIHGLKYVLLWVPPDTSGNYLTKS